MAAAKTDPRRGRWRALCSLLAVAACVPFNGCNLNPRPEHSSADLGPDVPGLGGGGVTGSPSAGAGGSFSGTGGAGARGPGASLDGGEGISPITEGGAEVVDGSPVDGATPEDAPDGPT